MKSTFGTLWVLSLLVAPLAGAWIEMLYGCSAVFPAWSPPSRGRGLKYRMLK